METDLLNRVENRVKNLVKESVVELCRAYWSWDMPIRKKVILSFRRLVQERRHLTCDSMEVEEVCEIGFDSQLVDFAMKLAEQLVDVAEIPVVADDVVDLVEAGEEISFYIQSVVPDMEIAEHLVVLDQVSIDEEIPAVEHLCDDGVTKLLLFGADVICWLQT